MQTLPSIDALGEAFRCTPRIDSAHPELGVLEYRVELETEFETVSLSVLPLAEEIGLGIVTKNPTRIFRLGLEDVRAIQVSKGNGGDERVEIDFHNSEVESLCLHLRPTIFLRWGNQRDDPERHPPWERE